MRLSAEVVDDLLTLDRLVVEITDRKAQLDAIFDERREIWRRLLAAGVTKAEIARASRCGPMNITAGLAIPAKG